MDVYIDGASSGNPGDAGVGIIFTQGEETLKNISRYIGQQTNNVAEYTALVLALQEALAMKTGTVRVFSDSELLCRQIKGEYKVRSDNIRALFSQAVRLIQEFDRFSVHHIPREQNRGADKLAKLAVKTERSHSKKPK
jgi:ribonuclease HI